MPDNIICFREVREYDVKVGSQVQCRVGVVDEKVQQVISAAVDLEAAMEVCEPIPVVSESLET